MKVITICGSMKFVREMMEISEKIELQENVVLMPIYNPSRPNKEAFTNEEILILDKMHRERIKLSDTILVVNVNNYIGNSTKNEIEFAKSLNKEILYYTDLINEKGENMKNNYIILHGSFGSKDGNWFPWLKEQLENTGKTTECPGMPIGVGNQNFENWSKVMDTLTINENTTIIAHSIAPIFVCKYLITNKIKVKKLIFVCGFNNYLGIDKDFDAVNEPMFIDNYEDVKNYCSDIVCFYSDNDPYVKYEAEKSFADKITDKQYVIKNGGHINSESGYTKFEEILKEI